MPYANEEIIDALKKAREAKGLSQRALSARTGVPQSHISKIEAGNADIRLSSLVEIARALELDIKLVPRRAVPAVESIVRSTAPRPANLTDKNLARELKQSLYSGAADPGTPRPAYRLDDDDDHDDDRARHPPDHDRRGDRDG